MFLHSITSVNIIQHFYASWEKQNILIERAMNKHQMVMSESNDTRKQ